LPTEATIRFAHTDLIPKNIIVEKSTITGFVDRALSGFFSDFREYDCMHVPMEMTSGWTSCSRRYFPVLDPKRRSTASTIILRSVHCV
ncbi:hypothetical protein EDD18DRAFT_1081868, partial [Armillaria luteobubalina]